MWSVSLTPILSHKWERELKKWRGF